MRTILNSNIVHTFLDRVFLFSTLLKRRVFIYFLTWAVRQAFHYASNIYLLSSGTYAPVGGITRCNIASAGELMSSAGCSDSVSDLTARANALCHLQ